MPKILGTPIGECVHVADPELPWPVAGYQTEYGDPIKTSRGHPETDPAQWPSATARPRKPTACWWN